MSRTMIKMVSRTSFKLWELSFAELAGKVIKWISSWVSLVFYKLKSII